VIIGIEPASAAIVCSVLYTYSDTCHRRPVRNTTVPTNLPNWRLPLPRYFFDIKNGHKLVDPSGIDCKNDTDAIDKAKRITIGVSLDKPAVDPTRHIVVTDDAGQEISRIPVYSEPSAEHPAR
jgi:hypothetical protein